MGRRIETGMRDELDKNHIILARPRGIPPDDYFGRMAKYIPAEIVGLYLTTSSMIPSNTHGNPRCVALWIVFILNFVSVPAYFWFATSRESKQPLWSQVALATIAFPVWVFAIGGPFKCFQWYESWIGGIALIFVTVAFGLFKPKRGQ